MQKCPGSEPRPATALSEKEEDSTERFGFFYKPCEVFLEPSVCPVPHAASFSCSPEQDSCPRVPRESSRIGAVPTPRGAPQTPTLLVLYRLLPLRFSIRTGRLPFPRFVEREQELFTLYAAISVAGDESIFMERY